MRWELQYILHALDALAKVMPLVSCVLPPNRSTRFNKLDQENRISSSAVCFSSSRAGPVLGPHPDCFAEVLRHSASRSPPLVLSRDRSQQHCAGRTHITWVITQNLEMYSTSCDHCKTSNWKTWLEGFPSGSIGVISSPKHRFGSGRTGRTGSKEAGQLSGSGRGGAGRSQPSLSLVKVQPFQP